MPTSVPFTRFVEISDIIGPSKSVGSHLASKLELFLSDERTLTDELCDMLCIWLDRRFLGLPPASPGPTTFNLFLQKVSPSREAVIGADLELIIRSPLGQKRCLLQAKVLEPGTGKLRYDSTQGWEKIKQQLLDARRDAGSLAFLLIYVPIRFLNRRLYRLGSYEQGYIPYLGPIPSGFLPSAYGATVIAADALLDASGNWISNDKIPQSPTGVFTNGIPFWVFLMRLMLCRIGRWSEAGDASARQNTAAFQSLIVEASEIKAEAWHVMERDYAKWIPPEPPYEDHRPGSQDREG